MIPPVNSYQFFLPILSFILQYSSALQYKAFLWYEKKKLKFLYVFTEIGKYQIPLEMSSDAVQHQGFVLRLGFYIYLCIYHLSYLTGCKRSQIETTPFLQAIFFIRIFEIQIIEFIRSILKNLLEYSHDSNRNESQLYHKRSVSGAKTLE